MKLQSAKRELPSASELRKFLLIQAAVCLVFAPLAIWVNSSGAVPLWVAFLFYVFEFAAMFVVDYLDLFFPGVRLKK